MSEQEINQTDTVPVEDAPATEPKAKKAKKEPKPKREKVTQHGMTRPKEGTLVVRVWEIADEISRQTGSPAERAEVLKVTDEEGIKRTTATTQFGRWRKFNGLSGRTPKATPAE